MLRGMMNTHAAQPFPEREKPESKLKPATFT
jgi:hypothetical protein